MNYCKITFPEKRGESFIGFADFQLYKSRPGNVSIENLSKKITYHFDAVCINKLTIRHWLIIEFDGYLFNDKKRGYERINCEVKIDDVKKLSDLIDKQR